MREIESDIKKCTVYKVVLRTGDGRFVSTRDTPLRMEYKLGHFTTSKLGRIFVFKELYDAQMYVFANGDFPRDKIIACTGFGVRKLSYGVYIPTYTAFEKAVQPFWKAYPDGNSIASTCPAIEGTYSAIAVIPRKVVEYDYKEEV